MNHLSTPRLRIQLKKVKSELETYGYDIQLTQMLQILSWFFQDFNGNNSRSLSFKFAPG